MKQIVTTYSFNVSSRTITLGDFGSSHPLDLKRLYLITDVSTNKILYNFADNTVASATVSSNNVITLSALQGGESSGDSLQIIYDVVVGDPTYEVPVLPTNAAQESNGNLATIATNTANVTSGNQKTQLVDGSGNVISSTSNALNVNVTNSAAGSATAANQTNGSQQAKLTDGTNVANVMTPGTANDTGNALLVGNTNNLVSFSATTAQAVGATDIGNYSWVTVAFTSIGTNSVQTFQASNDNVNWTTVTLFSGNGGSIVSQGASTTYPYSGPSWGKYFRINVTGITAGTTAGTILFSTLPRAGTSAGAVQVGTWAVGSNSAVGTAVPANAFYMGMSDSSGNLHGTSNSSNATDAYTGTGSLATTTSVYNGSTWDRSRSATAASATTGTGLLGAGVLGIYNATAPTATSGDYYQLQLDASANLKQTLATLIAGENLTTNRLQVEQNNAYTNVTATGTTVVKSGANFLHSLTINNPSALTAATTATTIAIYDNTAASGTLLGTLSLPIAANIGTALPFSVTYDVNVTTGITVVVTLGSGGSWTPNITLSTRA